MGREAEQLIKLVRALKAKEVMFAEELRLMTKGEMRRGKGRLREVIGCMEKVVEARSAEAVERVELQRVVSELGGEETQLVEEAHLRNRMGQKMNEMQRRNEASKERRDFTAKRLQRESALIIEEHNRRSNEVKIIHAGLKDLLRLRDQLLEKKAENQDP